MTFHWSELSVEKITEYSMDKTQDTKGVEKLNVTILIASILTKVHSIL